MKTIEEIYTAINPLPALLSAKGKVRPEVKIQFEANAEVTVQLMYAKINGTSEYDRDMNFFMDKNPEVAIAKAIAFIHALPSAAEDAKKFEFMKQLGKVIDTGKNLGIEIDYMTPLAESLKRLSENVITDQTKQRQFAVVKNGEHDDIPF